MTWRVLEGDCVEAMRAMPETSVDAVICDPPYGLEFMGKDWDAFKPSQARIRERVDGRTNPAEGKSITTTPESYTAGRPFQAWCEAWATEALRVLKPGGHLLAFGGTRTYHRLTCAIEDAGFEVRDCLAWLYGSGFPKSLDVSKAIDKAAGADREVVGEIPDRWTGKGTALNFATDRPQETVTVTGAAATPNAERWQGWGTALKPAHEPIVLARKPLTGTVAGNVLAHGTGALNVDGCRIEGQAQPRGGGDLSNRITALEGGDRIRTDYETSAAGRWPANVVLDPEAAAMLDEQTGDLQSGDGNFKRATGTDRNGNMGAAYGAESRPAGAAMVSYGDTGGASRFFYVAKANTAERNTGLHGQRNSHPTVKPVALMRWLIRLITPPGGTVLDPFTGSGTTGCAAALERVQFIGCEREPEYVAIARARIQWWSEHPDGMRLVERLEAEKARKATAESGQLDIFAALDDAA